MQSIRARLILGTASAVAVILSVFGAVIYTSVRTTLINDFDDALGAKAKALASMVEFHRGNFKLELDPTQMPEFSRKENPHYFQCWRNNGETLFRSASLERDTNLTSMIPIVDAPKRQAIVLPDGRHGRLFAIRFRAAGEEEDDRKNTSNDRLLQMTVAQSTAGLDRTLGHVLILLIGVCGFSIVGSSLILVGVVRRGLRPIETLASRISAIGDSTLSTRIDLEAAPDELKPVVERLNDLLDRLSGAFDREKSFTADVAHELRTPLAGLEATLEVCASRSRAPQEYQQTVVRCLGTTRQMHSMVDNLLALARAEAGQLKLSCEPVRLKSFMEEIWALFAARAEERGLAVVWQLDSDPLVSLDPDKVRLVLQNLFDNAVSYTDAGGTITIHARVFDDGWLRFDLSNTGSQLGSADTANVFDRFWRADESRSQTGLHCGLGLTLSRRMLELMNGTIEVTSIDGLFRVVISLPASVRETSGGGVHQR